MKTFMYVATGLVAAVASAFAFAGTPGDISSVPEPGTFELLALGGVVAAVIAIRKWRRK